MDKNWYRDPTGRHELRYWDGVNWTDHVSDRGVQGVDPVAGPAPAAAAPRPGGGQPWGAPSAGGQAPPMGGQALPVGGLGGVGGFGINPSQPLFRVHIPGAGDRLYSVIELQQMAKGKTIRPETMVQHVSEQFPVQLSHVPGVFSDKSFTTAIILSVLVGSVGVDRFYLGYTGLGVAKLLTLGGCGVWWLIDLIMIATRNLNDSNGLPLSG